MNGSTAFVSPVVSTITAAVWFILLRFLLVAGVSLTEDGFRILRISFLVSLVIYGVSSASLLIDGGRGMRTAVALLCIPVLYCLWTLVPWLF